MAPAAGAEGSTPAQPPAIQRLDDAVVHKIAAGEVVQRPASALKEMVENSLDAGAKHITVVVKEGGLKYLQIQDDGCGIRLEDLPILCHRHTTSKLRAFEDLETISTLGFRGEALASISFVAHVTVTTMTASMQHGFRVKYSDGEMLNPGPKPVAAVPGTSIIVEDMFYNMLARRRAFKPGPEEHNLLQDVLQRYAIYKAGSVGFTLKRQGEARSDLHTLPTASRLDVIRGLFGPEVASSLLPLQLTGGSGDVSEAVALDGPMGFVAEGYVSNLTYMGRRSVLILFINGRPVEQGQLRRAIETVYTAQNPKANKPWVYLDLKLPPRHVEVNMHPTKKEVGFLHQQDVIDEICRAVERVLTASMHTRTFKVNTPVALVAAATPAAAAAAGIAATAAAAAGEGQDTEMTDADPTQQQLLTQGRQGSGPLKPVNGNSRASLGSQAAPKQQSQPVYRPEKLVRTDHRTQSIEGFLVSQASAAAMATAAAGGAKRRKSSVPGSGLLGRSSAGQGRLGAGGDGTAAADGDKAFGADGWFSNASLHLQAAAAEEAAAAAELAAAPATAAAGNAAIDGAELRRLQQQEALLRPVAQPRLPEVRTQLSSIWELLGEVQDGVHGELQQLFKSHTWVGMADHQLALLQHGTRLYLVNMAAISRDLFYQLLLTRWEAVPVMHLAQPLHVGTLMELALRHEEAAGRWQPEPGSTRAELCELVQALLAQKAEMLQEYVGLAFTPHTALQQQMPSSQQHIQQQQERQPQLHQQSSPQHQQPQQPGLYLTGLPVLLDGYVPDLSRLPRLVLQLARDVDWETEVECFKSLAAALADFYALQPLLPASAAVAPTDADEHSKAPPQPMDVDASSIQQQQQQQPRQQGASSSNPQQQAGAAAGGAGDRPSTSSTPASSSGGSSDLMTLAGHRSQAQREWLLRHVVMPAVKYMYRPPRARARDGSVLLLTSMEKLYRVFERCGW